MRFSAGLLAHDEHFVHEAQLVAAAVVHGRELLIVGFAAGDDTQPGAEGDHRARRKRLARDVARAARAQADEGVRR